MKIKEEMSQYRAKSAKGCTFRLDEEVKVALDKISAIEQRPKNKIVNEAVARYLHQEAETMKTEMENIASRLRDYKKKDPTFAKAIAALAEGEAAVAEDPAEGEVVDGQMAAKIRELAWS